MAIYDRGRETIEVWPPVVGQDPWGNEVLLPPDPETQEPILVERCVVQPMSETVDMQQGTLMVSHYRVLTRVWPTQAKAIARWRGQMWDVRENPARRQYTRRTQHDTVYMKAREEEPPHG